MQLIKFLTAMLLAGNAVAADVPKNLMTAASVSCPAYLALPQGGPEAMQLECWVAGRIVAIAPAPFQTTLAKISFKQMQNDLRTFCEGSIPESTLFDASAILIYGYQQSPPA